MRIGSFARAFRLAVVRMDCKRAEAIDGTGLVVRYGQLIFR